MNCAQADDEILVADLAAMAGGESPLASHLASCERCRGRVASILGGTAGLALRVRERRRAARRRATWIAVVPVAAAIALAMVSRSRQARDIALPRDMKAASPARSVSVDVAPGQRAAVLKTADPNVTLIWLSPGVGQ